jgi:teichuronic acid exporter
MKNRSISATLWSGTDVLVRQALQFSVAIVLARLLTPEEFGTVALLSLLVGLATVLVEGGLGVALIQRGAVSRADESTVFWINLLVGSLLAILLCVLAPLIAAFYRSPVLQPLTYVMASNVFVGALGAIHIALLTKRLQFRVIMIIGTSASFVSSLVAVWMAFAGYGVWALAAQSASMTGCTTLMLWLLNPWRPSLTFSAASARRLFSFGGYVLAANVMDTAYTRIYTLLVGKLYDVRELGLYARADSTQQIPTGALSNVVSRVAFPLFSSVNADFDRLRQAVRLAARSMLLVNVPMMLGLAALSQPFVIVVFGSRWVAAAPILQVLCLGGTLWPLHVINVNVLMAQGHARLLLRVEVVKKLLGLALLALGALGGVMGIAWGCVAFSGLATIINGHYTKRFLGYGARSQIQDVVPIFSVAAPTSLIVYSMSKLWEPESIVGLLGLTALGALAFFACAGLVRLGAFCDLIRVLRTNFSPGDERSSL